MKSKSIRTYIAVIASVILFSIAMIIIIIIRNAISNVSSSISSMKSENTEAIESIKSEARNDINVMAGQEIYIPAYSSLKPFEDQKEIDFSIILSIRNTDPTKSIVVSSIDFYNSEGDNSRKFISEPLTINPMATTEFTVSRLDKFGGSGANFYVKWISDTPVNEPVVEAIILGASPHCYSWVSPGRVVKNVLK